MGLNEMDRFRRLGDEDVGRNSLGRGKLVMTRLLGGRRLRGSRGGRMLGEGKVDRPKRRSRRRRFGCGGGLRGLRRILFVPVLGSK